MKRVLIWLLAGSAMVWGQKTRYGQAKPKPNPADYTVDVRVQSSRLKLECGDVTNGSNNCYWLQYLSVTLDGKTYELRGNLMPKTPYLLKLGDYKAKVLKEDDTKSYAYQRTYQILFPDGGVAEYMVVGESQ